METAHSAIEIALTATFFVVYFVSSTRQLALAGSREGGTHSEQSFDVKPLADQSDRRGTNLGTSVDDFLLLEIFLSFRDSREDVPSLGSDARYLAGRESEEEGDEESKDEGIEKVEKLMVRERDSKARALRRHRRSCQLEADYGEGERGSGVRGGLTKTADISGIEMASMCNAGRTSAGVGSTVSVSVLITAYW
jgi:hypothetical protein